MSFYNFNSTITNQVLGTQVISAASESLHKSINTDLAHILERERAHQLGISEDREDIRRALLNLKTELAFERPKKDRVVQALAVIGGLSSLSNLADKIKSWLEIAP